jgi:DNA-directed RNA polymerase subunit omega
MARITSEDAVAQVGNRYDLVLIASRRARELSNGYAPHIVTDDTTVVKAIREIEQGHIGQDYLYKSQNVFSKEKKSQ